MLSELPELPQEQTDSLTDQLPYKKPKPNQQSRSTGLPPRFGRNRVAKAGKAKGNGEDHEWETASEESEPSIASKVTSPGPELASESSPESNAEVEPADKPNLEPQTARNEEAMGEVSPSSKAIEVNKGSEAETGGSRDITGTTITIESLFPPMIPIAPLQRTASTIEGMYPSSDRSWIDQNEEVDDFDPRIDITTGLGALTFGRTEPTYQEAKQNESAMLATAQESRNESGVDLTHDDNDPSTQTTDESSRVDLASPMGSGPSPLQRLQPDPATVRASSTTEQPKAPRRIDPTALVFTPQTSQSGPETEEEAGTTRQPGNDTQPIVPFTQPGFSPSSAPVTQPVYPPTLPITPVIPPLVAPPIAPPVARIVAEPIGTTKEKYIRPNKAFKDWTAAEIAEPGNRSKWAPVNAPSSSKPSAKPAPKTQKYEPNTNPDRDPAIILSVLKPGSAPVHTNTSRVPETPAEQSSEELAQGQPALASTITSDRSRPAGTASTVPSAPAQPVTQNATGGSAAGGPTVRNPPAELAERTADSQQPPQTAAGGGETEKKALQTADTTDIGPTEIDASSPDAAQPRSPDKNKIESDPPSSHVQNPAPAQQLIHQQSSTEDSIAPSIAQPKYNPQTPPGQIIYAPHQAPYVTPPRYPSPLYSNNRGPGPHTPPNKYGPPRRTYYNTPNQKPQSGSGPVPNPDLSNLTMGVLGANGQYKPGSWKGKAPATAPTGPRGTNNPRRRPPDYSPEPSFPLYIPNNVRRGPRPLTGTPPLQPPSGPRQLHPPTHPRNWQPPPTRPRQPQPPPNGPSPSTRFPGPQSMDGANEEGEELEDGFVS